MGHGTLGVDEEIATRIRGVTANWTAVSKLETARRAGIAWTTFDRKIRAGSFTISELYRIAEALDTSIEVLLPYPTEMSA